MPASGPDLLHVCRSMNGRPVGRPGQAPGCFFPVLTDQLPVVFILDSQHRCSFPTKPQAPSARGGPLSPATQIRRSHVLRLVRTPSSLRTLRDPPHQVLKCFHLSLLIMYRQQLPQPPSRVQALQVRRQACYVLLHLTRQLQQFHNLRYPCPTQPILPSKLRPVVNHPGF